jgi:tetratricopeptide (TPR) repeat protein
LTENLTQKLRIESVKASSLGQGRYRPHPMGALFCSFGTGILVLLTTITVAAQDPAPQPVSMEDLPPALAASFSQGVADLKAGRLDAAEIAFRNVLRSGGERAFVHHNLGIVLQERGRHDDALTEFRAAIRLDPSFGPARLLAGTSLLALARNREARSEIARAARLMPQEIVAHLQLADACERLDDRACVADAYRHVAQLAPGDPEYAYRLGSAYLNLSQWVHEQLVKTGPNSGRVHQALAREYIRQGRSELALSELQQAAEAAAALPEIHLTIARIYFHDGRLDDAAREIERELAIVPFSRAALELKARIKSTRQSPSGVTPSRR